MTDGPHPEPDRDPGRDPEARLRALQRRLRRDKLALERLNPLERPDAYTAALGRVVDLEARRRDLRGELTAAEPPIVLPDEPDGA